jgi:hypothetical protein
MNTELFSQKLNALREEVLAAISKEFTRAEEIQNNRSILNLGYAYVQFDEPLDVEVCPEVNSQLDVRINGLTLGSDGTLFAEFEVVESTDEVDVRKLNTEILFGLYEELLAIV